MPSAIYIVEDHPVMRWGYQQMMRHQPDLEVCGAAASAREALEAISAASPDLVLVDISLQGMNGIELVKHLQARWEHLPVLIVSAHEETLYAERALRAGARGYVMKSEPPEVVVEAIRAVLRGKRYVSTAMTQVLLDRHLDGGGPEDVDVTAQLTDREMEMFELLGQGHKRSEIAEAMHISPKTVDTYRERIKGKLGVESSAKLTQRAVAWVHQESS